eukprot:TRINITY_DN78717_c0_g1_i1.p2 TRINITY_DN78717_c0_g1~~TRINITY_DN78717_c0_g1_i1.p2  ORF type:complete len:253 (+),score=42.30 TRINITY_DN78717_c0_g1_i1:697-1455(+)
MWTGSSGAFRAPHPAQTPGDAPHTRWNDQDTRPSSSMWDRDDVSSRLTRHAAPPSASNTRLEVNPQHSRAQDISNSADGIPDAPRSFPELESMPLRDLRVLHEERARFDDFVSKHQYQQQLDSIVSRERSNVEAFEREHNAITSRMDETVDDQALTELRENLANLETEVNALQKRKDEWMEQNSPERLMERLRIAINESETKSEALEKSMLSSSMHFDDFLSQYIACRQKYHERVWKLEQLQMEVKKKSFGR